MDLIANSPFRHLHHQVDFCVVGGGMAGFCAALAAARRGAKTVLMQDRPVLGGNSSSEIGVHIIGADRVGEIPHVRETGILEEVRLHNIFRNPQAELSIWDLVLYDRCIREPNLSLLLNCSVLHGERDGNRLASVTGWQLSTQTWHTVEAAIFADCSGDAVLAPISGAEFRFGREARSEYGESIAPENPDDATMGFAHIYYTREYDRPMPFKPFDWARTFERCDELPWGAGNHKFLNYSPWWCELGGEYHTIHDSELIRDEIFKVNLGLWDHIKNRDCQHREAARNRAINQLQFVPGRRESRRYVGHHVLTQNDIEAEGRFDDVVAYGGWTMDDHHPAGVDSFRKYDAPPTIHHPAPCPYGIPYRSLLSRNVENLMFAGRVGSCTHSAMSSTRVMGTCAVMGQAVGTAAALTARRGCSPAALIGGVAELQQQLLRDDAYLPGVALALPALTREAVYSATCGDAEPVRDGIQRQVGDDPHALVMRPGDHVTVRWDSVRQVRAVSLTLDTAMERSIAFRGPGWQEPLPEQLPKAFTLEAEVDGVWREVAREDDNWVRHRVLPLDLAATALRYTLRETHGAAGSRLYGLFVTGGDEWAHRGAGA